MYDKCTLWILACLTLSGCTASQAGEAPGTVMEKKMAQFAPAVITADVSGLADSERRALDAIIAAARYLDPVFLRQAYAKNPDILARLEADRRPDAALRLQYFWMMKGPWDRQDHWRPFATTVARPKGAGYYPTGMTKREFERACSKSSEAKAALQNLFTVVRRDDDGGLMAAPYSQVYAQWLEPSARLLRRAADLTDNVTLATFLRSRAQAFLDDDYYQSDKDWMDLDSSVEVTMGPYEVYEDELFGYKAAFEVFVTVTDADASAELSRYKAGLAGWEKVLPYPDEFKPTRGRESPIRVVDLVYAAGDARTSVQTIAFNLPNDERVRKEKGAKKVLMRNVIKAKFDMIMRPLAERALVASQLPQLSADAFFNQTLFHELSHSLGPAYVKRDGQQVEVRMILGGDYSAIEECKADVMGAFLVQHEIEKGTFPKAFREQHLVSYFIGLFRSVRFGISEAHGKGAAVQINYFMENGAARWDPSSERLTVDPERLEAAVAMLLNRILVLQAQGDVKAGKELLATYGVNSAVIDGVLAQLDGVPVDLRPIYPLAGERE